MKKRRHVENKLSQKPKECISCKSLNSVELGAYLELKKSKYVVCADCCRDKLGLL